MAADDLKNVDISVLKHFEDNLASVASIDLPGVPFDKKGRDEWFQPRVLGPVASQARRTERRESYTLNVNCFARSGYSPGGALKSPVWRHLELAGEVREIFYQSDVAVQDWDAVGDPTIGYIRFEEVSVERVVNNREAALQQAAVSVTGVLILS